MSLKHFYKLEKHNDTRKCYPASVRHLTNCEQHDLMGVMASCESDAGWFQTYGWSVVVETKHHSRW